MSPGTTAESPEAPTDAGRRIGHQRAPVGI
jgi:hypothetical protein